MPNWYAVAAPGLERIVAAELAELGHEGHVEAGGVRFEAGIEEGARLARTARTPARMLLEVCSGKAHSLEELVGVVRKGPWKSVVHPFARMDVSASVSRSRLRFREPVEKKVQWAISEAIKGPRVMDREKRPSLEQRVQVRVADDNVTLSVDAGGELLHVRGWRQAQGPAPLRENLAAALLLAIGWDGSEPLVDPFCGAGTIPIEARLLAERRSPFARRGFSCDEWPGEPRKGSAARGKARADNARGMKAGGQGSGSRAPSLARAGASILGTDRDARVLGYAAENARRASVEVSWKRVDVADLEAPAESGVIVTNPPYGVRLAQEARVVEGTFRAFGNTLRERFGGWRVGFLSPEPALAALAHRGARRVLSFKNGGVSVGFYVVELA
jgi:putative N6-adenine-specific DNA methylase